MSLTLSICVLFISLMQSENEKKNFNYHISSIVWVCCCSRVWDAIVPI